MGSSEYETQKKWRSKNMTTVSARYKNEFVNKFKASCEYLGLSQSEVIRKAMADIIAEATRKQEN